MANPIPESEEQNRSKRAAFGFEQLEKMFIQRYRERFPGHQERAQQEQNRGLRGWFKWLETFIPRYQERAEQERKEQSERKQKRGVRNLFGPLEQMFIPRLQQR